MTKNTVRSRKTKLGLAQAAAKGRKPGRPQTVSDEAVRSAIGLGTTAGAAAVGLSKAQFIVRRRRLESALLAIKMESETNG